jgi:drug/metabolite transporter (DMT)-like permease
VRRSDRFLLLALVVTWALSWPIVKIGVSSSSPLWYAAYRYAFAALCAFAFIALRSDVALPTRRDWPVILISGGLQMAAYAALTSYALTLLPSGRAVVVAYSTPVWVVPLSAWRLREQPTRRALVAVALGAIGACVIAAPSLHVANTRELVAYAMLLAAAGAWATSIVYVRAHPFAATPSQLAPWQMLLACLLLWPIAAIVEGSPQVPSSRALVSLLYVGPVATAFAYWAVVEVGRRFAASTVSVALLATPPLGILFSTVSLREPIGPSLVCGALLIAAGIGVTGGSRETNNAKNR